MITFVRTWVAQSGKLDDVINVLKGMATISLYASGRELIVATEIGGNAAEASLIWQGDSPSESVDAIAKVMSTAGFPELMGKLGTMTVEGASREHLYRHV